MANQFFLAPTANFIQKTLSGAITDVATTITLNNTTNLTSPGYATIDRTDSAGTSTPNAREVVYYTGISGNDLTGVTRAADGSTARSHSDGAIVETMPTIGMWNSLTTIVATGFTSDGYLKAINSPVSIGILHTTTRIAVSGASITGFPTGLHPSFSFYGILSGPSTLIQTPLIMPQEGTWQWFNIMTRTVASGASAIIDININGTSIFSAGTRPAIAGAGTFVSTASIATKGFNAGDRLSWDMDTGAGLGLHITDLVIEGRAT